MAGGVIPSALNSSVSVSFGAAHSVVSAGLSSDVINGTGTSSASNKPVMGGLANDAQTVGHLQAFAGGGAQLLADTGSTAAIASTVAGAGGINAAEQNPLVPVLLAGPGVSYLFERRNAGPYPGTAPLQSGEPRSLVASIKNGVAKIRSAINGAANTATSVSQSLVALPGKVSALAVGLVNLPQAVRRASLYFQLRRVTRLPRAGLLSTILKSLTDVFRRKPAKKKRWNAVEEFA